MGPIQCERRPEKRQRRQAAGETGGLAASSARRLPWSPHSRALAAIHLTCGRGAAWAMDAGANQCRMAWACGSASASLWSTGTSSWGEIHGDSSVHLARAAFPLTHMRVGGRRSPALGAVLPLFCVRDCGEHFSGPGTSRLWPLAVACPGPFWPAREARAGAGPAVMLREKMLGPLPYACCGPISRERL